MWTCRVLPNDGEDTGPGATASVTITAPVLSEICTDNLSGLTAVTTEATSSYSVGNWGPDHGVSGLDGFFVFEGDEASTFRRQDPPGSTSSTHSLDEEWAGTGQVVVDGHLYFIEEDTADLVKFHIETNTEVARTVLSGMGTGAEYGYFWGSNTAFDLDTDGVDVMLIHSSDGAAGRFQVSEVDPDTLAILSTWTAPSGIKADHSNAFIACGVLYAMEGAFADTTVSYAWEIGSSTTWDPGVDFEVFAYLTSAQYSSATDTLYVWDYGTMVTMSPVWSP